jgi:hypothetical protein
MPQENSVVAKSVTPTKRSEKYCYLCVRMGWTVGCTSEKVTNIFQNLTNAWQGDAMMILTTASNHPFYGLKTVNT